MKKSSSYFTVFGVFLSFAIHPLAGPLQDGLNALFLSHTQAVWSIQVEERDSGKILYALTPERALIPASNEKLVVCGAALLRLGPDFSYQTNLYITGTIRDTILEGDLIVTGSGDPSIGGRFYNGDLTFLMREWAGVLKEKGIQTIRGNLIGVDDAFDDEPHGLNWHPSDLIEWYAAEVGALSFNDGCVDIKVLGASQAGQNASVSLNPPTQYLSLNAAVQTVANRNQERGIVVQREKNSTLLDIRGSIRARGASTAYATVPNPTLFFVTVFKETLAAEGIRITGDARDCDDIVLPNRDMWQLIHTHNSLPLNQLIDVCMKSSQNLYAEHFFKTLGNAEYGVGTWQTGALAIKDIYFRNGCKLDSVFLADGSGLSRENRINAKALVQVLKIMNRSVHSQIFYNSFPQAGVDGTLKQRMRGTDAHGRVFAKTGTLNGCRALSGIINSNSGKTYFFSMLGNTSRQAIQLSKIMDDACALIVSQG